MTTNSLELAIQIAREAVPSLATLIAAFFGAWFAYRLQDKAKRREQRASEIDAANRALFALFQQLNSLKLFQKDMIDPFRDHPGIVIAMQPLLQEAYDQVEIDLRGLSFLLGTKHKQLLLDLFIEQQRFREAIKVINFRSAIHLQQVQPALLRAGVQEGVEYPENVFSDALGPLLYGHLRSATQQVIYHVDRTVGSLDDARRKFVKTVKELFPEGDFLNFELIEEPANRTHHSDAPLAARR